MDDLIRRADAINAMGDYLEQLNVSRRYAKSIINKCPSAQRTGKWIDMDEQSYTWKVRCSVCGHERSMMSTQGEYPNYCEDCGARMDLGNG